MKEITPQVAAILNKLNWSAYQSGLGDRLSSLEDKLILLIDKLSQSKDIDQVAADLQSIINE